MRRPLAAVANESNIMKTIHPSRGIVSASLGLLLTGSTVLQAAELLTNGSFDTTSAWTVVAPQNASWTCIANGEAFLHPYPSGYVGVVIKQKLSADVSDSKTVKFSAVMSKLGGPSGNTIAFKLTYLDGSSKSHDVEILSPSNDSISTQTPLSKSITLPAAAVKLSEFSVNKTTNGMFTLQSVSLDLPAGPAKPEIVVQQPAGSGMTDGGKKSFGTAAVGSPGKSKVFTIQNTGGAKLTGLAIKKDGSNAKDFVVTNPAKSTLAPGSATTFKVTFKPGAKGTRNAAIHIKSNDADENPFDIKLTGLGTKP
jgi:hypothetical protein